MDDFNMNNKAPLNSSDQNNEQPAAETRNTAPQNEQPVQAPQSEQPMQQPQAEQPAQAPQSEQPMQQPQAEQPAQAPQSEQPQAEEPRTPFQTPVQHPEFRQAQQQTGFGEVPPMSQKPHTPKNKKHSRGLALGLCGVAAACLLFAGGAVVGNMAFGGNANNDSGTSASTSDSAPTLQINSKPESDSSNSSDNYDTADGMAGEDIYKKVNPSVVSVISTTAEGTGSGSGVIMSKDGYIITNNHVVDGAQSVSVQLSDGTSLDAEIIGTDEQTDLAVIKVTPTSDLTAAEFGDSDELEPGEYAYAIGSPGGVQFANTITGGRISAINRDLTVNDRVMTLIQTDASINNGNSGGALINKYGQVVGITSAKLSGNAFGSATVEGMGFAIPINTAKDIVDELIQNGYVSGRPSIGITGQNVESADGKVSGVQVYSIDSRAKAASEGLQVGDVITAVDGTPTPDMDKVNELKQDKKAGDKLTLSVYRISTGKTLNITITLTDSHDLEGNDPNAQTQQSQSSQSDNSQQNDGYGSYGFSSPFGSFGW
ncbi:PDZ domain-containing protein [Butyricicoccus sp. AF22-28AC]|nr:MULTISPECIES: trypsin-like peptidase domain-containing protein [unclassified Butyricicoccus]RHQ74353.1 PDZ domain-containing protein [Butyricicoccus sp. AF24-19AC]RHQ81132.1 PDZ domain-containing protein [Butyricicoccus sp. AF22-28AC]RHR87075.1 PDZ domain-containing protein [Butyricicoccus sp. AF15-40]